MSDTGRVTLLAKVSVAVVMGVAGLTLCGCAQVKPAKDYARAADLIRRRVPTTQVYNPEQPQLTFPDISKGLSLDQALQRAMLANRDLQAAFGDIGVGQADLVQSALWKNPTFSLSGMLPEGGGLTRLNLGWAQDIVDLWQVPVRKKIARNALDEAIYRVVNGAVATATATKQAYHNLQSYRQALRIAQDNIEIARRSDEIAAARYNAGQAGKADADLARASLLQARLLVIDIQRQIRVAENDLALLLGLNHWPDVEVPLDPLTSPPPAPTEAAAIRVALSERLDLQAEQRAVLATRQRIREEWLKVFPSVEAEFRAGTARTACDSRPEGCLRYAGRLGQERRSYGPGPADPRRSSA